MEKKKEIERKKGIKETEKKEKGIKNKSNITWKQFFKTIPMLDFVWDYNEID